MKLLAICAAIVVPFCRRETPTTAPVLTPELVSRLRHLCAVAAGSRFDQPDFTPDDHRMDPEELYSRVFFKLTENNCEVLRSVGSDVPTNSWLKKVIRSTAVDMFRHELGRIDWEKLGSHAQLVCRLVISYDYPAEEARALLLRFYGIDMPIAEIDRVVSSVRNRKRIKSDPEWESGVYSQIDEETGLPEQIFVDHRQNAEDTLGRLQEDDTREKTLTVFIQRLKPDDKVLISLCFGLEGDAMTMREIAVILDSTETALNKRKARIFEEFRTWLEQQQTSLDELVCRSAQRSTP